MFVLVVVRDTIVIHASQVHSKEEKLEEAIRWKLASKYSNRVLPGAGLVIKLYDILQIGDGKVYPGEGSTAVTVQFRLVVFRPFDGEILLGTVKDSIPEGLIVSMGFFDHVFIPSGSMQADSDFDPQFEMWKWNFEDATGEGHAYRLLPSRGRKTIEYRRTREKNTNDNESGLGPTSWWDTEETNGENAEEEEEKPTETP